MILKERDGSTWTRFNWFRTGFIMWFLNTVMNVPQKTENFLFRRATISFSHRIYTIELINVVEYEYKAVFK
jgi:hypothetical protein